MRGLTIILILISTTSYGQRFRYGLDVGYVNTKYTFPVSTDVYRTNKFKPYSSLRIGPKVYLLISKSFRIGTGVQFLSSRGNRDAGHVKANANQNSIGTLLLDLDNSYLIYPLEANVDLVKDARIKPYLSFGCSFFTPLKENIKVEIVPDNPYQYSEMYSLTINKNTSDHQLFGFFIGLGGRMPISDRHELSLSANYRVNTSYYRTRTYTNNNIIEVERHHIRFNMLDAQLGWTIGK